MATLDLTTITEYLERSMQNCSLSSNRRRRRSEMVDENDHDHILMEDKTLDLNSHISIPSYMEQCLDLKTGEIYYMNSTNGMRVKEDPRKLVSSKNADEFSGESYGSVFSEEDSSYHESEESSSESSPSSGENQKEEDGLVVAGCKACFMYFP